MQAVMKPCSEVCLRSAVRFSSLLFNGKEKVTHSDLPPGSSHSKGNLKLLDRKAVKQIKQNNVSVVPLGLLHYQLAELCC